MKRTPVVSSSIASIGYDAGTSTLEVEFQSGLVYQYFGVLELDYRRFMKSESLGSYFARKIRDHYQSTQV